MTPLLDQARTPAEWAVALAQRGIAVSERTLRAQCASAGVPFFFKQWGEWGPRELLEPTAFNLRDWPSCRPDKGTAGPFYRFGKKAAGRLLDGALHDEFPA